MNWLSRPASATQVTHGSRLWLYALAAIVLAFLTLPTLIVVPMSFSGSQYLEFPPRQWSLRWYQSYLGSASWMQATRTSFAAGALTMLVSTPLALMAAYGLDALRGRWAAIIYAVLVTPIIVPVILVGIAVFYAYVRLNLVNSLTGIVLGSQHAGDPCGPDGHRIGAEELRHEPRNGGAQPGRPRLKAFLSITLPQIRFAVVTAAVLSFLTSFDEVIVALFVSGGDNSTLTRNMFNALRDQIDPTIATISTIMIVVSSLLLAVAQFFGRPKGQ